MSSFTSHTPSRLSDKHIQLRPAIHADLPEDSKRGEQVCYVSVNQMPFALLGKVGDMFAAMEKTGLLIERDSYRVSAYLAATTEQLDERLATAQERWDNAADRYDAALVSGTYVDDWTDRHTITNYANKMGCALPWNVEN